MKVLKSVLVFHTVSLLANTFHLSRLQYSDYFPVSGCAFPLSVVAASVLAEGSRSATKNVIAEHFLCAL